ncbi:hypothetical protein B0H15DRAFT_1019765 [Mycena belliarum]|uniref:Uncharacterized protein n=1 Tax=Mycena belliarum TaxID=1033014 RepID=A0AAD6XUL7_9AGAR|nr:hypothetical protein B0H15DRAFT_1019765 [Mycena belliae]
MPPDSHLHRAYPASGASKFGENLPGVEPAHFRRHAWLVAASADDTNDVQSQDQNPEISAARRAMPVVSAPAACLSNILASHAPSFPPWRRQASIYAVFYVLEVFPTRLQGLDLAVVLMHPTRRRYRLIDRRVGAVPTCRCRPRQSSCSGDMLRQNYAVFELIHVFSNAPAAAQFELAGLTCMTCLQHLAFNGATTIFLFNIRASREWCISLRVARLPRSGALRRQSRRGDDTLRAAAIRVAGPPFPSRSHALCPAAAAALAPEISIEVFIIPPLPDLSGLSIRYSEILASRPLQHAFFDFLSYIAPTAASICQFDFRRSSPLRKYGAHPPAISGEVVCSIRVSSFGANPDFERRTRALTSRPRHRSEIHREIHRKALDAPPPPT